MCILNYKSLSDSKYIKITMLIKCDLAMSYIFKLNVSTTCNCATKNFLLRTSKYEPDDTFWKLKFIFS